jgi:hypothetical protein
MPVVWARSRVRVRETTDVGWTLGVGGILLLIIMDTHSNTTGRTETPTPTVERFTQASIRGESMITESIAKDCTISDSDFGSGTIMKNDYPNIVDIV